MDLRMNGNTVLVIVAILVTLFITATTVMVLHGDNVPEYFRDIVVSMCSALVGGGLVNHVNTTPPKDGGDNAGK